MGTFVRETCLQLDMNGRVPDVYQLQMLRCCDDVILLLHDDADDDDDDVQSSWQESKDSNSWGKMSLGVKEELNCSCCASRLHCLKQLPAIYPKLHHVWHFWMQRMISPVSCHQTMTIQPWPGSPNVHFGSLLGPMRPMGDMFWRTWSHKTKNRPTVARASSALTGC